MFASWLVVARWAQTFFGDWSTFHKHRYEGYNRSAMDRRRGADDPDLRPGVRPGIIDLGPVSSSRDVARSGRDDRGGGDRSVTRQDRGRGASGSARAETNAPSGKSSSETENDEVRVSADGTVRIQCDGGGALDVATVPLLELSTGQGPRSAFVSPGTGRRGPFLALVHGVPSGVAQAFYDAARNELAVANIDPATAVGRAVRAGCRAIRSRVRRRHDLDAFGFTVVLVEATSQPFAFVAQLPPCQLYAVDAEGVRAVPEIPTGLSVGQVRSDRRWEVEIEIDRIPLSHEVRLVLTDAALPTRMDPATLQEFRRMPVARAASMLVETLGEPINPIRSPIGATGATLSPGDAQPEAIVVRFVLPLAHRASSFSLQGWRATLGAGRGLYDRMMGTGWRDRGAWDADARETSVRQPTGDLERGGPWVATDGSVGIERRRRKSLGEPEGAAVDPSRTGSEVGAPVSPFGRVVLVPSTLAGTPLASARYPRVTSPWEWWDRLVDPPAFLPGGPRAARFRRLRRSLLVLASLVAVGVVAWQYEPFVIAPARNMLVRIAPPPTATPLPPTPTTPPVVGRTIASARGRFVALAVPPNTGAEPGAVASVTARLLDDVGDIVGIRLGPMEGTRDPVPPRPTPGTGPQPTPFPPRGFLATGGGLIQRDDGVLYLDPGGTVSVLGNAAQPPRVVRVRGTGGWVSPVAAVVYGPSMYVFDAGKDGVGLVWRHPATAGGQYDAEPVAWLQAGQRADLSLASDVATDGVFWVSRRDGTILRLAGGRAEVLALSGVTPPARSLGAIYTDQATKSLYVIDEPSRRMLRLNKDGAFEGEVSGVIAPGEIARGLWVDEGGKRALVLTTQRLALVTPP